MEKFGTMDPSFMDTRECKLVDDIITQWEAGDVEAFTQVVFDYDKIHKLDGWKTTVLLKVKNAIKQEAESIM